MARIAPTANAARGLKKTVAVGMVLVGRSRCRPHANPHDDRRKDIARKLKSRRNDGRRARQQADGDVPARQKTAYANADDDDAAGRSIDSSTTLTSLLWMRTSRLSVDTDFPALRNEIKRRCPSQQSICGPDNDPRRFLAAGRRWAGAPHYAVVDRSASALHLK